MANRRPFRRSFTFVLLAAALVGLLGATECSKVDRSFTGPQEEEFLPAPGRDPCVRECWEAAMDAREREVIRHKLALLDCNRDPECVQEENELHERNLRNIKSEFFECREECHEQGGGGGGQ